MNKCCAHDPCCHCGYSEKVFLIDTKKNCCSCCTCQCLYDTKCLEKSTFYKRIYLKCDRCSKITSTNIVEKHQKKQNVCGTKFLCNDCF